MISVPRLARRAFLVLTVSLAAGSVPAGAAHASGCASDCKFHMPSRHIRCYYAYGQDTNYVLCHTTYATWFTRHKPRSCRARYGSVFFLDEHGRRGHVECGETNDDLPGFVLSYGRTLRAGANIRCRSRRNGLRCSNRGGHGFFLSRRVQRVF